MLPMDRTNLSIGPPTLEVPIIVQMASPPLNIFELKMTILQMVIPQLANLQMAILNPLQR